MINKKDPIAQEVNKNKKRKNKSFPNPKLKLSIGNKKMVNISKILKIVFIVRRFGILLLPHSNISAFQHFGILRTLHR